LLPPDWLAEENGVCCTQLETTPTYDQRIHDAYRLIARHVYRAHRLGEFAYVAFDHINATYFDGRIPETLILWQLTDHGHALGWCRSALDGPPIITLHPALIVPADDGSETKWHVPRHLLGWCYAFDVLLHEMIHACVEYVLGGWEHLKGQERGRSKWSSHNNPLWIGECNRIAAQIGLFDRYTLKRYRRVEKKVRYQQDDADAPDFERFPHADPAREEFYRRGVLPFAWGRRCTQLETTGAAEWIGNNLPVVS
jgi:hypothetical protein